MLGSPYLCLGGVEMHRSAGPVTWTLEVVRVLGQIHRSWASGPVLFRTLCFIALASFAMQGNYFPAQALPSCSERLKLGVLIHFAEWESVEANNTLFQGGNIVL